MDGFIWLLIPDFSTASQFIPDSGHWLKHSTLLIMCKLGTTTNHCSLPLLLVDLQTSWEHLNLDFIPGYSLSSSDEIHFFFLCKVLSCRAVSV